MDQRGFSEREVRDELRFQDFETQLKKEQEERKRKREDKKKEKKHKKKHKKTKKEKDRRHNKKEKKRSSQSHSGSSLHRKKKASYDDPSSSSSDDDDDDGLDWVESTATTSSSSSVASSSLQPVKPEDEGPRLSRESWMLVPPKRDRPATTETNETTRSATTSSPSSSSSSSSSSSNAPVTDWRLVAPRPTREQDDTRKETSTTRPRGRERTYLSSDFDEIQDSKPRQLPSSVRSSRTPSSSSSRLPSSTSTAEAPNDTTTTPSSSSSTSSSSSSSLLIKRQEPPLSNQAPIPSTQTPVAPQVDLNQLNAQALKAQIRGDTELHKKLLAQIEEAKAAKEKKNNTVIIGSIDDRGVLKHMREEDPNSGSRKRRKEKVEQFDKEEGRVRYFADDDVDLKTLVERERRGGVDDMDVGMANAIVAHSRNREMDEEDWDNFDTSSIDNSKKKMTKEKMEAILKQKAIKDVQKLDKCWFCFDNPSIARHLIIAMGDHVYLALPQGRIIPGHCLIIPMKHTIALTEADENVITEIQYFKKCLTRMFGAQKKEPIFMETVMHLKRGNHSYIECFPLPNSVAFDAPLYFKKAIMESDSEWSQNKKVVETSGTKGIQRSIPKGFPYFHVEFGNDGTGYAHAIEDEVKFRREFGKEIVGGMLDLERNQWNRPRREDFETQRQHVLQFLKLWEPFDWTVQLEGGNY